MLVVLLVRFVGGSLLGTLEVLANGLFVRFVGGSLLVTLGVLACGMSGNVVGASLLGTLGVVARDLALPSAAFAARALGRIFLHISSHSPFSTMLPSCLRTPRSSGNRSPTQCATWPCMLATRNF
jgi:hypothetical protein